MRKLSGKGVLHFFSLVGLATLSVHHISWRIALVFQERESYRFATHHSAPFCSQVLFGSAISESSWHEHFGGELLGELTESERGVGTIVVGGGGRGVVTKGPV